MCVQKKNDVCRKKRAVMSDRAEEEEKEVECSQFPRGVFPGMESSSIYSLAGCYLFSCTDIHRYCSLSCVLAGVAASVVVSVSDVCGQLGLFQF